MASKKTWLWILAAFFGFGVICLIALAGAGVYFVSQHVDAAPSTGAEAIRAFEAARRKFKDPPLFEVETGDRVRLTRKLADLPTSPQRPSYMWVLAWDPDDERLVKVSLPFWLLRLGRQKIDVMSGRGFDFERLHLDIQELERIGPVLIVDHRVPSGERVLVWTQ